mgnify:CR=1 FL=1
MTSNKRKTGRPRGRPRELGSEPRTVRVSVPADTFARLSAWTPDRGERSRFLRAAIERRLDERAGAETANKHADDGSSNSRAA